MLKTQLRTSATAAFIGVRQLHDLDRVGAGQRYRAVTGVGVGEYHFAA